MDPLVDDVCLLLLDPDTGRPLVDSPRLGSVVGGAILLDLALRGRLAAEPGRWGGEKVHVVDASPTGDEILDRALSKLGTRAMAATTAVSLVSGYRTGRLVRDRMAANGMVRHEPGGFFKLERDHPDPGLRKARLAELASALDAPDPAQVASRTIAVISLVHSVQALPKLLSGATDEKVEALTATLTQGEWTGDAVAASVRSAQSAVTAAIVASTTVAVSAASSE